MASFVYIPSLVVCIPGAGQRKGTMSYGIGEIKCQWMDGRMVASGESYWITGVFLLGVYLILGMGFFYLPM